MLVGHRIFVCIYDKYHFLCFIKMIRNRKLQNKVYNLNLKTCLLYIGSFYVYMIVMIRGYWFWIHVCISTNMTIFSIIHIFMYMIICKCVLIWDKLIWKETHLKEIYLLETKRNWLKVYCLAKYKLTGLLGFFFPITSWIIQEICMTYCLIY